MKPRTSLLLFFLLLSLSSHQARKTGGRTEIEDVEENKEVQEMGRFAVRERNQGLGPGEPRLEFRGVVRAERQVVAGVMYYLRIEAAEDGGVVRCFEAVVLVRPWVGARRLVRFCPVRREGALF